MPIFNTPFEQYKHRHGQECAILRKLNHDDENPDFKEVGELYKVQFQDGEIIDAWPEEIGIGEFI
jgi:hypothetical protein